MHASHNYRGTLRLQVRILRRAYEYQLPGIRPFPTERRQTFERPPNLHASTSTGQQLPCLLHVSTPEAHPLHQQTELAYPRASRPLAILVRWQHPHASRRPGGAYPWSSISITGDLCWSAKKRRNETVAQNYPSPLVFPSKT